MMNAIQQLIDFKRDPDEDFYGILGCDRTSSTEQILAEYKLRAKEAHPDKSDQADAAEKFKRLQTAKNILCDPQDRKSYDKWMDSGISMSFKQWRGMKDAVHTSMHWATPRFLGRMLGLDPQEDEPLSLRTSPVREEEEEEDYVQHKVENKKEEKEEVVFEGQEVAEKEEEEKASGSQEACKAEDLAVDPDDIVYAPTPYETLEFRVETPPPEFGWDRPREEREKAALLQADRERKKLATSSSIDFGTSRKRGMFAQRRQDSSVGMLTLQDPVDDEEMRRRFRNYEI